MPEVQYKSKGKKKVMKKKFEYNKKGMDQAKKLAKETGGKIKMNKSYT